MHWNYLLWIAVPVILVIIAAATTAKRGNQGLTKYSRSPLFNKAEHQAFATLLSAAPEHIKVLAKVRLADVVKTVKRDRGAFARVSQKHLDFVLYNMTTRNVECAIELDGPTHQLIDQQQKDAVKNHALATAGIQLHRIPANQDQQDEMLRSICNANIRTGQSGDAKVENNFDPRTGKRTERQPVQREPVGERSARS